MDYEDFITPWTTEQKAKAREETDKVYAEIQYGRRGYYHNCPWNEKELKESFLEFKRKEMKKM